MPIRDEVLNVGVDVDVQGAIRQMSTFQRVMSKSMSQLTKMVEGLGKTNTKLTDKAVKGSEEWADAVDDLTDAYSKEEKVLKALEKQMETASDEQKKALQDQIDLVKKLITEQKKRGKKEFDPRIAAKSAKESAKEFGSALRDTWGSFASKDLKGTLENATRGFGKGLKATIKGAAAGFGAAGGGISRLGAGISRRGVARGGAGGMGMRAAGGALKGLGGLTKAIGPLLNVVTKIGPILMTVSTVIVGIVKLFIDAEAQAKGFQKEILQSASTAEFLAQAGGNADEAYQGLEDTLRAVRDAAYDAEQNLKWGITAEQHKAVLNVLTQEGVSLRRLEEEAKRANKEMKTFSAEVTHIGIAYSRALGVPLQEINQLQAEMMTDLGMSLEETRLSFAQMTRAAGESGIAANKFFAIIRGVSQDLSLYNNRMEDAVKMLKMLGKVMNPREAQKFMQTAMQGLKNMGRQERLRMTLLAGTGKMAGLVKRDTERKAKTLATTLGMTAEEVIRKMKTEGPKGLNEAIERLPKEQQGAAREAAIEMKQQMVAAGKGTFGTAIAARTMGPAGALEAMKAALGRFGGAGKSLMEMRGELGAEMMAENLGVSEEQLSQMVKFEQAMEMERATLKKIFEKPAEKRTQEEIERLKKAQAAGIESASEVDKAGYDQIFDTLDESAKEAHKDATKVENFAEKQANLTQSMLDKLGVIVDFLMNQLYNVLVDIYDGIVDIMAKFGIGKEVDRGQLRARRHVRELKAGKGELSQIVDAEDFSKAMAGSKLVQQMNTLITKVQQAQEKGVTPEALAKDIQRFEEAKARGESGLEPGKAWSKADDEQLKQLKKEKETTDKIFAAEQRIFEDMSKRFSPDEWAEALKMAGADDATIQKFKDAAAEAGDSAAGALVGMEATGTLSNKQIQEAMRKLPVWSSAGKLRKTAGMGEVAEALTDAGMYDEAMSKSTESTAKATETLATEGTKSDSLYVKFGNSFMRKYTKALHDEVLDALRIALFEYYLYSAEEDREKLVKAMKDEKMGISDFAKQVGKEAEAGRLWPKTTMTADDEAPVLAKQQHGGFVYGVSDGLAMVRAAGGEGLASVGPGETIVPAYGRGGAGGGDVNVTVNGIGGQDLASLIKAKVIDGIAEYKRRERFA